MKESLYKKILSDSCLVGYAYCKVLYDPFNNPFDCVILEANDFLYKLLQVNNNEEIRFNKHLANYLNDKINWLQIFFDASLNQKNHELEIYSPVLNSNCKITIQGDEKDHFIVVVNPISKAEENVHLFEEAYKIIDNNTAGYIYFMDLKLNFTYLSPSCKRILGYNHDDEITNLYQIMTPSSLEKIKKVMEEEFEFEKDRERYIHHYRVIELEVIKKDGTIFLMEHTGKFIRNQNKEPVGIVGVGRDLSQLRIHNEQLKNSQEQLRLILDSTAEGIFGMNLEGVCTFCNKSCLNMLGYDNEDELLNQNMHKLIHHHDINGNEICIPSCDLTRVLNNDNSNVHINEQIFWRKDGTSFFVDCYTHQQYRDNQVVGYVVTFFDITSKKKVEEDLKESERSKSVLVSNLPGMAYRCKFDKDWTMQFVSDGCYQLTGYKPEKLINNRDLAFNDLISSEYQEKLWLIWNDVLPNHKHFKEEYTIVAASGETKWVLEQGQGVYDKYGNVEAIEGFIVDITEQKLKQEEITYLSHHDYLTGIYNRIYFEMEKKHLDKAEFLPLSIIIGDINGLKLVNDAFGHDEGDKLIIKTAKLIKDCINDEATLARTGGDEFAILLPFTDGEKAYKILKNIQRAYEDYNNFESTSTFNLNISLGFATKESMDQDFSKIQKSAEDYMYKRKMLDRNSLHSSIITSIKTTMYENSQETEAHAERIHIFSKLVGNKLKLPQVQLDELALLATLHDIGKVGIDDKILKKPGKLTETEWKEMRRHPEIGYRIAMASPELVSIAKYILHHHERWDGKGYPQGLKGAEIPLLSRIIAVVDAYDAMTNDRTYRKAMSKDEAIEEIIRNSGTQFDPAIVKCFVLLKDKLT